MSLPVVGSRVVYFPQGHSEQVGHSAVSLNKLDMGWPSLLTSQTIMFCKRGIKRITLAATFLVLLIVYIKWID